MSLKTKITKAVDGELSLYHATFESIPSQPWKNGRGLTREIAKASTHPFSWRMSSAVIDRSGPFSEFPNYERIICLMEGESVMLSHSNGKHKSLALLSPYRFSGDLLTVAKLESGQVVDLNLFLLKGSTKGAMYPVFLTMNEEYQLPLSAQEHFVVCVKGALKLVERHGEREYILKANSFLRVTKKGEKEFPNLKITSLNETSTMIWIPINFL